MIGGGFDGGMRTNVFVGLLLFGLLCSTSAAGNKADEQAVRDADAEWSKVAGAKDLDKTIAYYSENAMVLPPNAAAVTTKDGIRNLWKGFLDSLTTISWTTTRVEVAKSGEMAVLDRHVRSDVERRQQR